MKKYIKADITDKAFDADADVRFYAARDISDPEVLEVLAYDPDHWVRSEVARNPAIPADAQMVLAKDTNASVLQDLANNPKVTSEVLDILIHSDNLNVVTSALSNPRVSDAAVRSIKHIILNLNFGIKQSFARYNSNRALLEILSTESETIIRQHVAKNKNTPASVLRQLATDTSPAVRYAVAINPFTPSEALAILAKDPHWEISDTAKLHDNYIGD